MVRIGRFGAYLESRRIRQDGDEELIKATLPQEITPADLDAEKAELILKQKADGPESIGVDPETGDQIYILFGQYGPYVQRGEVSDENPKPKRASLPVAFPHSGTTTLPKLSVGLLGMHQDQETSLLRIAPTC